MGHKSIFLRSAILLGMTVVMGCTGYRPVGWNPFAWSSKPTSSGWPAGMASTSPSAQGRDLSKSPAEANESWLASSWKSATSTLSAPFQSQQVKPDPLALSTPSNPTPEFHLTTGQMYEASGDNAGAIAQYEKALALDANNLKARIVLARLYDRQGDLNRAIAEYQRAAAAHPESGLVHNDLGLFYARHKQIPQSVQELEIAIKTEPANQMYRNNIATVLIEMGREDEAFEHLAAVNPPAVAHYNFGYLLHKRGRNDAATRELQTALGMDRSLGSAAALLAQLQSGGTPGSRNANVVPTGYPNEYNR